MKINSLFRKITISLLKVFGFLIVLSLFALSVYQVNAYTSDVYFIHNSEAKIGRLSQENKVLEISLVKADSLANLGSYVQNFEKTSRIEYIRVLEGTALAK